MYNYDVLSSFDAATASIKKVLELTTAELDATQRQGKDVEKGKQYIREIIDLTRANDLIKHPLVMCELTWETRRYKSKISKNQEKRIAKLNDKALKKLKKSTNRYKLQQNNSTRKYELVSQNINRQGYDFFYYDSASHSRLSIMDLVSEGIKKFKFDQEKIEREMQEQRRKESELSFSFDRSLAVKYRKLNDLIKFAESISTEYHEEELSTVRKFIGSYEETMSDQKYQAIKVSRTEKALEILRNGLNKLDIESNAYRYIEEIKEKLEKRLEKEKTTYEKLSTGKKTTKLDSTLNGISEKLTQMNLEYDKLTITIKDLESKLRQQDEVKVIQYLEKEIAKLREQREQLRIDTLKSLAIIVNHDKKKDFEKAKTDFSKESSLMSLYSRGEKSKDEIHTEGKSK